MDPEAALDGDDGGMISKCISHRTGNSSSKSISCGPDIATGDVGASFHHVHAHVSHRVIAHVCASLQHNITKYCSTLYAWDG